MRIELTDRVVHIEVVRKDVRALTLRVYPDASVRLTAPRLARNADLRAFVEGHAAWLENSILKCAAPDPTGTIRLEGELIRIEFHVSSNPGVYLSDGVLRVAGETESQALLTLDKWWRSRTMQRCMDFVTKWIGIIEERGAVTPHISVRKMKTMWGSCTQRTGRIRFNYYLLCVAPTEIEYVVLHELAHLLYPNHGKRFKAFLSSQMPDWKQRREALSKRTGVIGSF